MRVSNALVINKHKQRDSFIRRVIDDAHIEYGVQKVKSKFFDKKNEEGGDMTFEDNSHFIEMTPRIPDSEMKGKEEKEGEDFGNFYKDYAEKSIVEIPKMPPQRKYTMDASLKTKS